MIAFFLTDLTFCYSAGHRVLSHAERHNVRRDQGHLRPPGAEPDRDWNQGLLHDNI